MSKKFNKLRNDLEKVINLWEPELEVMWEEIQNNDSDSREERLSYIIEYNRFRDLLISIKWLYNDKEAITRYSKKIASIKCELNNKAEYENIGLDILDLIKKLEKRINEFNSLELNDEKNDSLHEINVNIKKCISLIKKGQEVITIKTKTELVNNLNKCIISRNKIDKNARHGIILQLREDKDFINCMAVIYCVECNNCNYLFECCGNADGDVYASKKCPKCESFDLFKSDKKIDLHHLMTTNIQKTEKKLTLFEKIKKLKL